MICNQLLKSKQHLFMHLDIHTKPRKVIPCPVCNKKFNFLQYVQSHLQNCHKLKYSYEMIRNAQKSTVEDNDAADENAESVQLEYNDITNKSDRFNRVASMSYGKLAYADNVYKEGKDYKKFDENYECLICNRLIKSKQRLFMHLDIHAEPKKAIPCPVCKKKCYKLFTIK